MRFRRSGVAGMVVGFTLFATATRVATIESTASGAVMVGGPKSSRVERALTRWRTLEPPEAAVVVSRAFCVGDDGLRDAARGELRRLGLAVVEPLLRCDSASPTVPLMAAEILCATVPLEEGALRSLLGRLSPLVGPAPRTTATHFWGTLGMVFPRAEDAPLACPNRPQVGAAVVDILLTPEAVTKVPAPFRPTFAHIFPALLPALRERVPAYLPTLSRWLDDPADDGAAALPALIALGPSAAPAVPALRGFLRREVESSRKQRSVDPMEPERGGGGLARAAEAAMAIGPAARSLTRDLLDALAVRVDAVCEPEGSKDVAGLLRALASLDISSWTRVRPLFDRAWGHLDGCPEPRSYWLQGAGALGRERVMEGLAAFGTTASAYHGLIRPLLTDERGWLELRAQAARTLRRMEARLDDRELALVRVLEHRRPRLERWKASRVRPGDGPPEIAAAHAAARTLEACREDAGAPSIAPVSADELAHFGQDENARFASCLASAACGPGVRGLAVTMSRCCEYAYLGSAPSACRGGVRGLP